MFEQFFDANRGLTLIGMCSTFATTNRRDIVKRLMGTCKSFNGYTFANAIQFFRSCEKHGWVEMNDGFCKVYFDYDN